MEVVLVASMLVEVVATETEIMSTDKLMAKMGPMGLAGVKWGETSQTEIIIGLAGDPPRDCR